MDSRDLWHEHIKGLTRQVSLMVTSIEQLEQRMSYYEEVFITLLTALKNSGILVEDPEGENEMPS